MAWDENRPLCLDIFRFHHTRLPCIYFYISRLETGVVGAALSSARSRSGLGFTRSISVSRDLDVGAFCGPFAVSMRFASTLRWRP